MYGKFFRNEQEIHTFMLMQYLTGSLISGPKIIEALAGESFGEQMLEVYVPEKEAYSVTSRLFP